jgi:prepilin-type N-terminal cleavage/methylation domain-containing protein
MLKKLRRNKKGFTLAELLIVVAIIGVLVAISIPIFTSQLKKARLATNQANARAAYAAATAAYLEDDTKFGGTYTVASGTFTADKTTAGTGTANIDISSWGVGDTTGTGGVVLGTTVADEWEVTLNSSGSMVGLVGTAN